MKRIILASGSPRRREILAMMGLSVEVIPAKGEEQTDAGDPAEIVCDLADAKAKEIYLQYQSDPELLVIGSDTIVVKDGAVLGKPKDEEDARRMLRMLSGTAHQVYTGVALYIRENDAMSVRRFAECTDVHFCELSDAEIDAYIRSGEPADKAGAYGIQGRGGVFVTGINGDYHNVVGLPAARLYQELKRVKGVYYDL